MTVLRTVSDPVDPVDAVEPAQVLDASEAGPHARRTILALLGPKLDRLAVRAADTIMDDVPTYRERADSSLTPQVAIHCHAVFQVVLACIGQDREPLEDDFPVTRSSAQARASHTIPLADFLHEFRLAQIAFCDHLLTLVRDRQPLHSAALAALSRLMQVIEVGSCVATEAYLEAERFGAASGERATSDLLEDLIGGREPLIDARLGLLRAAGLGPSTPFVVMTARSSNIVAEDMHVDAEPAALARVADVLRRGLGRTRRGLVAVRETDVVAIVPRGHPIEQLSRLLDPAWRELAGQGLDVTIGVSTTHHSLAEVPAAYRESELAGAALGRRCGVLALDEVSSFDYLLLSEDTTARRLIDPRIAQFVEEDVAAGGTYLETIEAYVANDLNAKVTADVLNLHVNTAYYRLDRIAQRTGRDMRRLTEVVELMIAVRLLAPGLGNS